MNQPAAPARRRGMTAPQMITQARTDGGRDQLVSLANRLPSDVFVRLIEEPGQWPWLLAGKNDGSGAGTCVDVKGSDFTAFCGVPLAPTEDPDAAANRLADYLGAAPRP